MKNKFQQRMSSDRGAVSGVETILLIALAIFLSLAIYNGLIMPAQTKATTIGSEITKFPIVPK